MRLTKQQAAKEQLESAIFLFFNEGSYAAIHALAFASLTLSQNILKNKGISHYFDIEKAVLPDKVGEWRKLVSSQANFLKHADRDSEAVLEFKEEQTKFQLIQSIDAYNTLYKDISFPMKVYQIWFAETYPELFQGHGWVQFKGDLIMAGFRSAEFTKETCGDLLTLTESKKNTVFGSRCRRLFDTKRTSHWYSIPTFVWIIICIMLVVMILIK